MNDKATTPRPPSQQYWQSLSQLAETPAMQAAAGDSFGQEFQNYDPAAMVNTSRRKFLKLAGASMALAGVTLTGCRRWPKESVVDQNSRPVGHIPGVPEKYASLFELGGIAQPLLVTTYDGRPIKIEGNPLHPLSATFGGKLGSSTMLAQASLLEMYDPERSRTPLLRNNSVRQPMSWASFTAFAAEKLTGDGAGIAVLSESTLSPTVRDSVASFQKKFPAAKFYEYEPISRDNERVANKLAFGHTGRWVYDLAAAEIIVSFDSDLFASHPNALKHTNDWAKGRKSVDTEKKMNRLYAIESRFTTTGTVADHRLPAGSRLIEQLVLQLAHKAGLESGQASLKQDEIKFVDQIWEDLKKSEGKAVVTGGFNVRAEVLAVIAAINEKIGALGKTVTVIPEPERLTHVEAIAELTQRLTAGQVETLIILGGNPVYDAPADLGFDSALGKAKNSIHLSLYDNETSALCLWHVNRAHYLESWGDAEFWDGSVGIQQPMIEPLFGGKTPAELLAVLAGEAGAKGQELLYRTWGNRLSKPFVASDASFQKILHDGFAPGSAAPVKLTAVKPSTVGFEAEITGYELRFIPDSKVYDGRFANNGWLQETPDLISKITWDNAALISYADAKELGVKQRNHEEDVIEIKLDGKSLEIPAFIVPGQPKGVITLALGYARKNAGAILLTDRPGSIGSGVGYDTYKLRNSKNLWSAYGATAAKTGATATIASTAEHNNIEPMGFEIRAERIGQKFEPGAVVHETTLAKYLENPEEAHEGSEKMLPLQLFPGPYLKKDAAPGTPDQFATPHAWGMTIDMSTCVGCNACVVACQAENNIPVVGRDEVIMTRQMQWLRIDRYFKSSGATYEEKLADPNPEITLQPMMCVHCENAPCEQVCPVAATVHDAEGLNTMVYNRCIGTRYCANNCPYKVRRFNFLDYQSRIPGDWRKPWLGIPDTQQEESIDKIKALVFNPNVTVRMRGVMEKCTYCVQRIKTAENTRRIEWLDGKRPEPTVDDFDVVTACQQACPAEAIIFGNLNDKESLVYKTQEHERAYQVLQELNNRPRTHHLAKIRNPAGAEA